MKRISIFALLFILAVLAITLGQTAESPKPFAFVVIGDSGCGCSAQRDIANRMIQWFQEKPFQTVLMVGDNIYGDFGTAGGNSNLFRQKFDAYYKPLLDKGVKFYASLGNHDLETRQGQDEIADKNRFHMEGNQGYYKFTPDVKAGDVPLITFYALNSPEFQDLGSQGVAQTTWLSQSLAADKSLWKVPFFHHPIYTPGGGHDVATSFKNAVENLLVAAGVRVAFAGHNHFYARMKVQRNIVYFVTGGGGRSLIKPKPNEETAVAQKINEFMYLEVYPDNINFWAVPISGEPIDHGAIARLSP